MAIISLNIISGPFSPLLLHPYNPNVGEFKIAPQFSYTVLVSFYSFFFVLLCVSDIHQSVFHLVNSASCILLLIPSSEKKKKIYIYIYICYCVVHVCLACVNLSILYLLNISCNLSIFASSFFSKILGIFIVII